MAGDYSLDWRDRVLSGIPNSSLSDHDVLVPCGPWRAKYEQGDTICQLSIVIGNFEEDPSRWHDLLPMLAEARLPQASHTSVPEGVKVAVRLANNGDPLPAVRRCRMLLWNEMVRMHKIVSECD